MNPIRWAQLRLRALVARRGLELEMQAEMLEHMERATERYAARGMSQEEAARAARREFGNVGALQEQARDARGGRWLHDLIADVRFAFRYFARHRTTTVIILVVLALGTSANTFIFSTFQATFLRPAPAVPADDAHVRVWAQERATRTSSWEPRGFTYADFTALRERRDVFEELAAFMEDEVILGGDSVAARSAGAQYVTSNFFRAIGVSLSAGQGFAPAAGHTADMTTVVSHAYAERYYGSAALAVGRRILVNQLPLVVVGVAPPRFQGAVRNLNDPVLWMPLSARAEIARESPRWLDESPALSLFGRLAAGATRERATEIAHQWVTHALPDSAARAGMARSAHVLGMQAPAPGEETTEMILASSFILGIGLLILLVACTNVSSLMVAAAFGRRHEISVRLSLGASRRRLIRQLVTESTLLAAAGSAVGLLLAWWGLTYMMKTEIDGVDLTPDLGTFTFVLIMAVGTGIFFGLSPALHATRTGVASALRESGTGVSSRSRLQRGLVAAQIALSQPLLVLLGVMLTLVISDYQPLLPGMSRHVVAIDLRPMHTGGPGQQPAAVAALIPRIAERPEVAAAVPDATGFEMRGVVRARDASGGDAQAATLKVIAMEGAAPGWFELVDVPIILGRDVAWADTLDTASNIPVVIGSDLARELWGTESPIGRTLASPTLPDWGQDSVALTIVGVYDASGRIPGMTWNGFAAGGDKPVRVFTARGKQWRQDRVLVRTRAPAASFLPELQRFVRAEAPALPVVSMATLAHADEQEYLKTLRVSALAGAGGALALLLASLGLYGIVSLAVRQRTREIGIRVAIGADPMGVARMFLRSGVRVSVVALAIGLPLSIAGLKILIARGLVIAPEVNPYVIGAVIALALLAVASAATWLPARRAALVDPSNTLRTS